MSNVNESQQQQPNNPPAGKKEKPATIGFRCKNFFKYHLGGLIVFITPIMLSPLLFIQPLREMHCLFVLSLVSVYWMTESLPLFITSLVPVVAYPITGVLNADAVAGAFFNDTLVETWCSLVLALAFEFCNLHRRIALATILAFGCSPRRLHLGVVIGSMFLSMWMPNAVTASTLCPIIKVVFDELESEGLVKIYSDRIPKKPTDPPYPSSVMICYYLSVAYASTIGGLSTLIGAGSNLTIKGLFETRFPLSDDIDYVSFFAFSWPITLMQIIFVFLWLQIVHMGWLRPDSEAAKALNIGKEGEEISRRVISEKYNELGALTLFETQVGLLFLLMNLLMISTHACALTAGGDMLRVTHVKTTIPFLMVTLMFFILPDNYNFLLYLVGQRPEQEATAAPLISWQEISANLQWGRLLLLGGGFVLAKGVEESGLSHILGNFTKPLERVPAAAIQFCCIIIGVFMTAFSSNIAVCNIMLAILAEVSYAIKLHPLYLTLPTAIACGLAFHLPISTPPNAVVADFANIPTKNMAIAGFGPTFITVTFLYIASQSWIYVIWPSMDSIPEWQAPLG